MEGNLQLCDGCVMFERKIIQKPHLRVTLLATALSNCIHIVELELLPHIYQKLRD